MMENQEKGFVGDSDYEIRQRWHVTSFLPLPDDRNVDQKIPNEDFWIEECIGCEDRDWNIPEMLFELRMVAEAAGVIPHEHHYPIDPREHEYGRIDAGLKLIFELLRTWALGYKHSRRTLERIRCEKNAVINFWVNHRAVLRQSYLYRRGVTIDNREAFLEDIRNAIEAFMEIVESDGRLRQYLELKQNGRRLMDGLYLYQNLKVSGEFLNRMGWLLHSVCRSYLSEPDEAKAGKTIHDIADKLRKLPIFPSISPGNPIPRRNKWDSGYLNAVGRVLQGTVDIVGSILNGVEGYIGNSDSGKMIYFLGTYKPVEVKGMLGVVEGAMDIVRIDDQLVKQYIYASTKEENRRCVAMLKSDELRKPIAAFSGYSDSNDASVVTYFGGGWMHKDLLDVCRRLDVDFANLSPGIVNKILRCEKSVIKGPMRKELVPISGGASTETIGGKYACCERKIVAKLDCNGFFPHKADLLVKIIPCKSCEGVINHYNLTWDIGYLYK